MKILIWQAIGINVCGFIARWFIPCKLSFKLFVIYKVTQFICIAFFGLRGDVIY